MRKFLVFLRDDRGATAVEYGLLLAFLSAAVLGGYTNIANSINSVFDRLATDVTVN